MADTEEVDNIDVAVKSLYRNRFIKGSAWTDAFSEFGSYVETKNRKSHFFRIHETPTDYRYSEDSHHRISGILSGVLINIQVERFEQGFQKTSYLLRSDSNYVSLREFIKIKRGNLEETELKFIIHILNFLTKLIPVLVSEQIDSELSLNTVSFQDERVRLCDYNLFFYPCNRRSEKADLLEVYMKKTACIIYALLTCQILESCATLQREEVDDLMVSLNERQAFRSNELFREIIRALLIDNILLQGKLQVLTQKMVYDMGVSLTDSNVTIRDDRGESIANEVGEMMISKKNTMTTIEEMNTSQKNNKLQKKKRKKCIIATICIILLLLGMAFYVYFFLLTQDTVPCNGCKLCIGPNINQCTKCYPALWLVKEDYDAKAGTCETQCLGQKYRGHLCIWPHKTSADSVS